MVERTPRRTLREIRLGVRVRAAIVGVGLCERAPVSELRLFHRVARPPARRIAEILTVATREPLATWWKVQLPDALGTRRTPKPRPDAAEVTRRILQPDRVLMLGRLARPRRHRCVDELEPRRSCLVDVIGEVSRRALGTDANLDVGIVVVALGHAVGDARRCRELDEPVRLQVPTSLDRRCLCVLSPSRAEPSHVS